MTILEETIRKRELNRLWAIHEINLHYAEIEEARGNKKQAEYHTKRAEEYFDKHNNL